MAEHTPWRAEYVKPFQEGECRIWEIKNKLGDVITIVKTKEHANLFVAAPETAAERDRLREIIPEAMEEPGPDYLFGLRCGLEDRDIHDRYEAVEHGWEQALEYVNSILANAGEVATRPPLRPIVAPYTALEAELRGLYDEVVEALRDLIEDLETRRDATAARGPFLKQIFCDEDVYSKAKDLIAKHREAGQ